MAAEPHQKIAEHYNAQPRKSTGAGVLFFNSRDELLIVKAHYLGRWLFVGGGIEQDESPMAAAIRECQEEIGYTPQNLKLAYVQYRGKHDDGRDEVIHFMFNGGIVDDDFLQSLTLQADEVSEAKFAPLDEVLQLVSPERARGIKRYFETRIDGQYIE